MKTSTVRIIVTLAAIACIGLAVVYNGQKMAQKNAQKPPAASQTNAPDVTVITAKPASYQAVVSGHGQAKAHWALTLKAQVEGELISLSNDFESGKLVNKGLMLAQIDPTASEQALATAKATLAAAELAWQEEKDLADQAKREWQRSGITEQPSSPLVFRSLQLASAQASVEDARAAVKTAQRDLNNSRISAPFDAVILTRDVDLGEYINTGETIATLNSTDRVEISVPLSLLQWQNLSNQINAKVNLVDVTTGTQWQGYVARYENHIDESSRQRTVIVALDLPFEQSTPLLPGTFVAVEIMAKTLNNVIQLPASALAQDGKIWFVDNNNRLATHQAEKVFERNNNIYIKPFSDTESVNIVVRPLVSYLVGMQVNPVTEEL